MTHKETWYDIPGYEGLYQVSNKINVKRVEHKRYDRNQLLKERKLKIIYPKNNWYPYLSLCKDGKADNVMIHRIVGLTFLLNPNNYPCINHKDGNKTNNSVKNLEWCSYSHNNKEAIRLGLHPKLDTRIKVAQLDDELNIIKIWESAKKAKDVYGCVHISDCCKGKRNRTGGYKWKYYE